MEYGKLTVTDALVHPEFGEILRAQTRKIRSAPLKPTFIVVHYTVSRNFRGVVDLLSTNPNRQASVQFVIGRDGELAQIGNLTQAMWHVGPSWYVHNGVKYSGLNKYAIGIEVCAQGWLNEKGEAGQWRQHPPGQPPSRWFPASEINVGRHHNPKVAAFLGTCGWDAYTPAQMETLEALIAALREAYPSIVEVIGHDDCSDPRERKQDPGPSIKDHDAWFDRINGRATVLRIPRQEPANARAFVKPAALEASPELARMVGEFEGFVSTAYYDSGRTLTIGYGSTNNSPTARRHLGQIKPGMTITKAKALMILRESIDNDYAPAVKRFLGTCRDEVPQHEADAMFSGAYNCGPGMVRWGWAKIYAENTRGCVFRAAQAWTRTATKDRAGNELLGLKRRRQAEAHLMVDGEYFTWAHPTFGPLTKVETRDDDGDDVLRDYQAKLKQLGFDPGMIDGLRGPRTTAAVKAFQEANGLKVDGILSRATMSTIDRLLQERDDKGTIGKGVGTGVAGGILAWFSGDNAALHIIVALLVLGGLAAILYAGWKYRHWLKSSVKGALADDAATVRGWFA